METIGLIGVGAIGSVFAAGLRRLGYPVAGFNKPDMAAFPDLGLTPCETPRDVAQAADAVLLCLPHEQAAAEVYRGPAGLLEGVRPGQLIIDLATYSFAFKRGLAHDIVARGGLAVDGEVSGTPDMLRARAGTVFLAGDEAACARAAEYCRAVADESFIVGPFGHATRLKLINNLLSTVHTMAAAEAMALGVKSGFEPHVLARALGAGSGSSKYLVSRAPMMADRRFGGELGAIGLFGKYLGYIPDFAAEADAATPLFDVARHWFLAAIEGGHATQDMAVVFELVLAAGRGGEPETF